MKKYGIVVILVMLSMAFSAKADDDSVNQKEIKALEERVEVYAKVFFEDVPDNKYCSSPQECIQRKGLLIAEIPNVEFTDYDYDTNSIFLQVVDPKMTTAKVIKTIINASGFTKVKKIIMPYEFPKVKPEKPPFEGMSKEEIKKEYDKYYRENPDLTPKKWVFD